MPTGPTQGDVDPVVIALTWLHEHPDLPGLLAEATGQVVADPTAHVGGIYEKPWPHLVVDDGPGGDLRDPTLAYAGDYEVAFAFYGHPNGAPGKAALRRAALRVIALMGQLPDHQDTPDGTPVVSRIRTTVPLYQPLSNGQPVYNFSVTLTIHP